MSHFSKARATDSGFTLAEILVVIAIIVSLVALVIPLNRKLRDRSYEVKCSNNLRNIGVASMLFGTDNNNKIPSTTHQRRLGGKSWSVTLKEYVPSIDFRCPMDGDKNRPYSYLINDFLTQNPAGAPELNYSYFHSVVAPEQTFLFAEAHDRYTSSDHFHFSEYNGLAIPFEVFAAQVAHDRHSGSANFLFVDGHVECLNKEEIEKRLQNPQRSFVDPLPRTTLNSQ